ncbi:MAG: very short patch repair endonuclease [Burkholderiales bacterium]
MDSLTPKERSERMALVKSKNTKPEITVRRLVFAMGYRYRLHDARLPGTPDLVFAGRRKALFVHGCFWHRHAGCTLARLPKSRLDFWRPKLEGNRQRDARKLRALRRKDWSVLVVWECELANKDRLARRIKRFLDNIKEGK